MMADVWAVVWKEWRELLRASNNTTTILRILAWVAIFGVLFPAQIGRVWLTSFIAPLAWTWFSLFLVTAVSASAFAGERERHTLETLLASRLPDRAILLGKTLASIGYGWGLMLLSIVAGLVTINVVYGEGAWLLYSAAVGLGGIVLSLLGAGLASAAGILISLRAATVRQAQQGLSLILLLIFLGPSLALQALPADASGSLNAILTALDATALVLVGSALLLAVDAILLALAAARFKRARLILD
jgi:ABC-2 type transport system permease protein